MSSEKHYSEFRTVNDWAENLSKELDIKLELAIKLVNQGIISINAMIGVEFRDLIQIGFTDVEATEIIKAYDNQTKND